MFTLSAVYADLKAENFQDKQKAKYEKNLLANRIEKFDVFE